MAPPSSLAASASARALAIARSTPRNSKKTSYHSTCRSSTCRGARCRVRVHVSGCDVHVQLKEGGGAEFTKDSRVEGAGTACARAMDATSLASMIAAAVGAPAYAFFVDRCLANVAVYSYEPTCETRLCACCGCSSQLHQAQSDGVLTRRVLVDDVGGSGSPRADPSDKLSIRSDVSSARLKQPKAPTGDSPTLDRLVPAPPPPPPSAPSGTEMENLVKCVPSSPPTTPSPRFAPTASTPRSVPTLTSPRSQLISDRL